MEIHIYIQVHGFDLMKVPLLYPGVVEQFEAEQLPAGVVEQPEFVAVIVVAEFAVVFVAVVPAELVAVSVAVVPAVLVVVL